jgi:hypothetical protein
MKPRAIWRKAVLFLAGLIACGLILVVIDVARHYLAIRRLEKHLDLLDWRYRFASEPPPLTSSEAPLGQFPDIPPANWHGQLQRAIASPHSALIWIRPDERKIEVDRSMMRDLAVLRVEGLAMHDCHGLTPEVLSELSKNSALRTLTIRNCDAKSEGVNPLWSQLPQLEVVVLGGKRDQRRCLPRREGRAPFAEPLSHGHQHHQPNYRPSS